ncbi:hypothetical protein VTK56DRAFT_4706 [Thermocarpiscus australiensis]
MVLQLYVWGPAFGLSSIDAECLAAIAYLAQTASPAEYQLIRSSPSAVPTLHLPSLYDPSTSSWTAGFTAITSHLQSHPPSPSFHHDRSSSPPSLQRSSSSSFPPPLTAADADADADGTAYAAFLTAHAAPLLALSLYVSSANYAAATRPAYTAVLPFPLPWTEPPARRAAMARRAAHLGLSSLDADADADAAAAVAERSERGKMEEQQQARVVAAATAGWVSVPSRKTMTVAGMLSPEQKARIRLEGLAAEVLDVLEEVEWDGQTVALRSLAFGYLALMLVPDVPRPWLREVMETRCPRLCEFVGGFRREVFGEGTALPWAEDAASGSVVAVAARFARGLLAEVPAIGGQWSRWWAARKKREALGWKGRKPDSSGDLLMFAGAGLALVATSAGIFFYRGLPPFGAALQTWRKPSLTLSSFGAAGAVFAEAFYGVE